MAACTAYTNIIVSGAGTSLVDGTYIPYSTGTRGGGCKAGESFTIWTKDGLNSYPRITVDGSGSGRWEIQRGAPPFPGAQVYTTDPDSFCGTDCPAAGLTWQVGPFGSDPVPTVTGTPPAPDPYAQWGGYANYARLRLLEYI